MTPENKQIVGAADLTAATLLEIARNVPATTVTGVDKILSVVRAHLGMDVAFVSEFVGEERWFRHVDAKGPAPLKAGESMSLCDGYCQRVVDGLLPELIVDTAAVPAAMALPDTRAIPIGSHMSVPIRLRSGRVYGTFCCFNFNTDPSLNPRDLNFMRAFADLAAYQIDAALEAASSQTEKSMRIGAALDRGQPAIVYQPVIGLDTMRVVGIEGLARFGVEPMRGPQAWFAEAAEVGQGAALELQAIRHALDGLRTQTLPDDLCVWLNASARTILRGDLAEHFGDFPLDRIVLELTEHDHVDDYAALDRALRPLRTRGVSVAIDDAGAGYSSMSHILNIAPEHIKLDLSLTRHIDADGKRRALAAALIEFGRQTGCSIVAEGVESIAELNALRELGVQRAQGHFLAAPVPGEALAALIADFASRGSGRAPDEPH